MQKYKVLKGGWTVKAVNPYPEKLSYRLGEFEAKYSRNEATKVLKLSMHFKLPETDITKLATYELEADCNNHGSCSNCSGINCCLIYMPNPDYTDFDRAKPILPLTHQQDEGIEVSGELVWQYQSNLPDRDNLNKWFTVDDYLYVIMYKNTIYNTRRACKPVSTNNNSEYPYPLEINTVLAKNKKCEIIEGDGNTNIEKAVKDRMNLLDISIYTPTEAFEHGVNFGIDWQACQPITTNSNPALEEMVAHTMGRMPSLDGLDAHSKDENPLSQEELKELAKKFEHIPKEMMEEILYDEPVTTDSKEELKKADLYWDLMAMPEIEFNKHKEIVLQVEDYHNHGKSPLPIASASIEKPRPMNEIFEVCKVLVDGNIERLAESNAEQLYRAYPFPNDNWSFKAVRLAYVEGAKFGAHWQSQTTQQPLIELLEKRIAELEEMKSLDSADTLIKNAVIFELSKILEKCKA